MWNITHHKWDLIVYVPALNQYFNYKRYFLSFITHFLHQCERILGWNGLKSLKQKKYKIEKEIYCRLIQWKAFHKIDHSYWLPWRFVSIYRTHSRRQGSINQQWIINLCFFEKSWHTTIIIWTLEDMYNLSYIDILVNT